MIVLGAARCVNRSVGYDLIKIAAQRGNRAACLQQTLTCKDESHLLFFFYFISDFFIHTARVLIHNIHLFFFSVFFIKYIHLSVPESKTRDK